MNATRRLSVRLTRRTSIRTTTSLGKVDVEKQQPKKEEQYNMNALVVKNLGYEDPTKGKTNVYYSYIENKYKQVENAENYLDILDIDEVFYIRKIPKQPHKKSITLGRKN